MYTCTSENVFTFKKLMWVVEIIFFHNVLFGLNLRQPKNGNLVPSQKVCCDGICLPKSPLPVKGLCSPGDG